MSGHSKWATIKRKKAAADSKRGKLFTKLLREIQVAAKIGGGSLDSNPRLRNAVVSARSMSVPGDTIDRAIKRGSGEVEGEVYEEIMYEGYAAGGVAVLVKALTENKHRTASDVRHAFAKFHGNLGGSNSVGYMFHEKGVLGVPKSAVAEEKLIEIALDAGADDVFDGGDVWEVYTAPSHYDGVRGALTKVVKDVTGEIRMVADTHVKVTGDDASNVLELIEWLDDLDDVQHVWANFEIDDSEIERIGASR